uniref:Superoxide dismutase n=1 Tax=Nephromyces sp. MMRI TaxID=2496275 RepID=A0A3S8V377_9APIC|nr:superoxide dismutase [Nephromyces sp. MMRI]AZL94540.1 superoxide dismutase [Nephromyces sp. MMRI]
MSVKHLLSKMTFTLPKLPYAVDALAPHIGKETIEFHYSKHHAGYVNKLNGLIKGTQWESKTLEEIIKHSEGATFNNAAQMSNHFYYWNCMSPNGGGDPHGVVSQMIDASFGSFDAFKDKFSASAAGLFGSGWVWLVLTPQKQLKILETANGMTPIKTGDGVPILACDVWEHAYYIDYRNDKAAYVKAWWNTINWNFANQMIEENS